MTGIFKANNPSGNALLFGYAIKNFVLFSYGYGAFTPEKKPAIWIMLFSAGLVLIASVFPYGRMEKRVRKVNNEL